MNLSPSWLISKYFILFDAIVNRIAFIVFFSDCSLSMYRNTICFYVLTFYAANLLNLFISFNRLLCVYMWNL